MTKVLWDFPALGSGNEQGYTNSGIELFKGSELIENLAREICQNSLDAHDETTKKPARVEFSLMEVPKAEHRVFAEYAECIRGCKKYWGTRMDKNLREFIERADKVLAGKTIPVLVARDFNTKGLTGAKAARHEESVWRALAHADGTSVNKTNESGGSYGIGKNAPFACSDLSVVFYNTFAQDGIRAFQGVSRLATITNNKGEATQGIGHYLSIENSGEWHPIFPENECSFRDLFDRSEHGTDIIVLGFNSKKRWAEAMTMAVLTNFFLAIHEGRMVVKIQDIEIHAGNLGELIEKYRGENAEMRNTYEWFKALTDPDEGQVKRTSILGEGDDIELYIRADKEYSNYVASFRPTGMRIRKDRKAIMQHFAAVVVVRGNKLSELLREAEPPRHNRWDHTLIHDKEKKAAAKRAIEEMDKWVLAELLNKYETVTQLSIDSGEGEYLPDDMDTMGQTQNGDDNLRVNQKMGEVEVHKRTTSSKQTGMLNDKGQIIQETKKKKKQTDPNPNPEPRPEPDPNAPPKPKIPKVTPPGETPGKNPDAPGRRVSLVNIIDQRAFAINADLGLYRAYLTSDRDYKRAYVTFSAVREDEKMDALVVEKYAVGGKSAKGDGSTIGPIALKKDTPCEIVVTFRNKEKMRLDMVTTEEKA